MPISSAQYVSMIGRCMDGIATAMLHGKN